MEVLRKLKTFINFKRMPTTAVSAKPLISTMGLYLDAVGLPTSFLNIRALIGIDNL